MNSKIKRAWSGVVAFGAAASSILVLNTPAAHAAGTLSGAAIVKNAGGAADLNSGDSDTPFTLRLPAGAACPGDSATDGYRVQTYMVLDSVDPATLTFGSAGPEPGGAGANFRQPLYTAVGGGPVVNQQTAAAETAGGPGLIINIPDVNYAVFAPGDIPAGNYNIGIACTLGPSGPTQMKNFWNVQKTFTAGGTSTAGVTWAVVVQAAPAAPTGVTVTAGPVGSLNVAFNPVTANPAVTGYTATATPAAGGAPITATGAGSPITVTGLANGTTYNVTVRATNSAGDSPESSPAVQGTTVTVANEGQMTQTVTVTVPAGALTFTQTCGKRNAITGDAFAPGAAAAPGTGGPLQGGQPPNVPNCGLALGTAAFAPGRTSSVATGILNQVTVSDTRQGDAGWRVTGQMASLTTTPSGGTISGNQLGWRPQATELGDTAGYTQTVSVDDADPGVAPPAVNHGLGTSQRLGYAAAGAGLGTAELDARVRLEIPLTAPAGSYSGVLSLTLLSGAS